LIKNKTLFNLISDEIYNGQLTNTFFADLSAYIIYICMYVCYLLNTSVQSFLKSFLKLRAQIIESYNAIPIEIIIR